MKTYTAADTVDPECARVHGFARYPGGRPIRFERFALHKRNILTPDGKEWQEPDLWDLCNACRSIKFDDFVSVMNTSGTSWQLVSDDRGTPVVFGLQIPCDPWMEPCVVQELDDRGLPNVLKQVEWVSRRHRNHHFTIAHAVRRASLDELHRRMVAWQELITPRTGMQLYMDGSFVRYRMDTGRISGTVT